MSARPATVEERLDSLEDQMIVITAQRGRLAIPPGVWAMIWSVLVTAVLVVTFLARLDARVTDLAATISHNQAIIESHITQPWHAAAGERYQAIDSEVKDLTSRVVYLERRDTKR